MTNQEAVRITQRRTPILRERYGVLDLSLFGPIVRECAELGSDVDLMETFAGHATSERKFGFVSYLEDFRAWDEDMVTGRALREAVRP